MSELSFFLKDYLLACLFYFLFKWEIKITKAVYKYFNQFVFGLLEQEDAFVHDVHGVNNPFTVHDFALGLVYYCDILDFGSISSKLSYCLARHILTIVV